MKTKQEVLAREINFEGPCVKTLTINQASFLRLPLSGVAPVRALLQIIAVEYKHQHTVPWNRLETHFCQIDSYSQKRHSRTYGVCYVHTEC